jgi:hypothetical protein
MACEASIEEAGLFYEEERAIQTNERRYRYLRLRHSGYPHLATPFFNTEKQLARLQTVSGLSPNLRINFFQGGHMIYLDDVARLKMKADFVSYYAGQPVPLALSLWTPPSPWPDESPAGTPTSTALAAAGQ